MKSEKKKKTRQESPRLKQTKTSLPPRYQFNISYDTLRCFINPSKSTRISKKKPSNSISKTKPPLDTPQPIKNLKTIEQPNQCDLTRQVSNSILRRIETQGIMCNWQEDFAIQPTKQQQQEDRRIWRTFSDQFSNKSFASTTDLYGNIYGFRNHYQNQQYTFERMKSYQSQIFQIDLDNIERDNRTTIMIRNIPNKYSVQDLASEIDIILSNSYDFLYLPCDVKNQCNVGYGFINFIDTSYLTQFYQKFHNKKWSKFRSQKICMLTYARLQGLESLIEHFQNSKVLNQKDKKYRPIIRQFSKIEDLIKRQQHQVQRP